MKSNANIMDVRSFFIIMCFGIIFLASCTFLAEDSCYDIGHKWDSTNKICTDDCVRQGGIFDLSENLCEIPPSYANKISKKEMFDSVGMACSDFQEILKGEFDLEVVTELDHYNSFQYEYVRLGLMSYTTQHDFGQDGVCNFQASGSGHVRIFIRKNAIFGSKYSNGDFDLLRIEQSDNDINSSTILWDGDSD